MNAILARLDGYKTAIGIVALAVYYIAVDYGVIEANDMLVNIIYAWTGVSLTLKLNKMTN